MTVVAEFLVPVEGIHLLADHAVGLAEREGLDGAAIPEVLAPLRIAVEEILKAWCIEEADTDRQCRGVTGFPVAQGIALAESHDIGDLGAAARTLHREGGLSGRTVLRDGQPHRAEFIVIGRKEQETSALGRAPSEAGGGHAPGIGLDHRRGAVFVQMDLVGDTDRLVDGVVRGIRPEGGIRDIDDLKAVPVIDHAGGEDVGGGIPLRKIRYQFHACCWRTSLNQFDHRGHIERTRSTQDLGNRGACLPTGTIQ